MAFNECSRAICPSASGGCSHVITTMMKRRRGCSLKERCWLFIYVFSFSFFQYDGKITHKYSREDLKYMRGCAWVMYKFYPILFKGRDHLQILVSCWGGSWNRFPTGGEKWLYFQRIRKRDNEPLLRRAKGTACLPVWSCPAPFYHAVFLEKSFNGSLPPSLPFIPPVKMASPQPCPSL